MPSERFSSTGCFSMNGAACASSYTFQILVRNAGRINRVQSVSQMGHYSDQPRDWMTKDLISCRDKRFSPSPHVHSGSGDHLGSYCLAVKVTGV
jgi:hypothetical protein